MKLTNEFSDVREWASAKGIYQNGDIKTQYIKLQEECGELAKAIINNDIEEIIDAIGDCVIVLTSIAKFANNINMPKNNFTGSQLENNITNIQKYRRPIISCSKLLLIHTNDAP